MGTAGMMCVEARGNVGNAVPAIIHPTLTTPTLPTQPLCSISERTTGVYKYQKNACGPMYTTIGEL